MVFFLGRAKGKPETYSARMKRKIDTEYGRMTPNPRFERTGSFGVL